MGIFSWIFGDSAPMVDVTNPSDCAGCAYYKTKPSRVVSRGYKSGAVVPERGWCVFHNHALDDNAPCDFLTREVLYNKVWESEMSTHRERAAILERVSDGKRMPARVRGCPVSTRAMNGERDASPDSWDTLGFENRRGW